jgi:Na+/H+ antiporter NhaD/arsenite permease-like protein
MDLTAHWIGLAALLVFVFAYGTVAAEERLHLRKSIPVLVAAGLIWLLIGLAYAARGDTHGAAEAARHNVLDFAELFLFLIVAMTYVNTLDDRGAFNAVRGWLVGRGYTLRTLFWVTGGLAFVVSPVADNLTTALVMGAVATAVGQGDRRFGVLASINVVVAANAGGAFSPFGDITTLMVWQKGIVDFAGFFPLVVPSLVNWLVPAAIMTFAIENRRPAVPDESVVLEAGAVSVALLFLLTIALTVAGHSFLHLPPALGMMFGLGILQTYSYLFNRRTAHGRPLPTDDLGDVVMSPPMVVDPSALEPVHVRRDQPAKPLHTFQQLERVEWDTLIFFYGVIMCVGGLGTLGYLSLASGLLYQGLGPTAANVLIGVVSAIVDNVPVMFAVLAMEPEMSRGEWLLVTLTAGVGGSLLSFGSAAGVALMGQARGVYTFMAHLRWSWAVALGYAASVAAHLLLNRGLF